MASIERQYQNEIDKLKIERKELGGHLSRLVRECRGILSLERDELRQLLSNTNVAVWELRLKEAEELLEDYDDGCSLVGCEIKGLHDHQIDGPVLARESIIPL